MKDNSHKAVIGGIFLVTLQDTELKIGVLEAIEKAKTLAKPVLVSEVKKVKRMDPLSLFAAGSVHGERFLWKAPSNELMIGIGICKKIEFDQAANRFSHIEEEWDRFLENAIIINEMDVSGTGPLMFGGFSFDPFKEKTKLWSKFSGSLFHVPKFMYSEINGQAYMTTNVLCTEHDDQSLVEEIDDGKNALFSSLSTSYHCESHKLLKEIEVNPVEWMKKVDLIIDELKEGPLKKVVLAREMRLLFDRPVQLEMVLYKLMQMQGDSFIFAFESNGDCFVGATPERLVKKQEQHLFITCLAGSIPRGETKEEDQELGETLLNDQKSLVEHQYVVDMIEAAMEKSCVEVTMPGQPQLMKLRDIQHLYTPVTGIVKPDTSLLLLVDLLHPTPALGGLPQKESVEKIREVEELDRGFYAAPLGWMDYKGDGDFVVSIRSGLIQGKEASIFAGCGVVRDSITKSEYEETNVKFRPMLSALGGKK
ncbi:isochorismate synthase [bacterium LRH843]|nr:isochorismate synthase [bacterium LRH843]